MWYLFNSVNSPNYLVMAFHMDLQAMSLVFVQLLELAGTMWLIQSTLQPFGPLPNCFNFRFNEVWMNRGWFPATATCLPVLLVAVAAIASATHDVSSSEVCPPVLESTS